MSKQIPISSTADKPLRKAAKRNKLWLVLACLLLGGGALFCLDLLVDKPAPVAFEPIKSGAGSAPQSLPEENGVIDESSNIEPATDEKETKSTSDVVIIIPPAHGSEVETDIPDMSSLGEALGSGDLGDSSWRDTEGAGFPLEATFYDLKLKRNGAPSGLKPAKPNGVIAALAKFFQSDWNEAELSKYYRSEVMTYASHLYLPVASAKYGPIAFEVGTHTKPESVWECKPSAWLAVYRGTVVAPKNGKFRFIGTGDDLLAVRFNHETVLEAGYYAPTAYDKANPAACHLAEAHQREAFLNARKGYEMIRSVTGCDKWNSELGGLVAGAEFSVKEGESYPIEIAIADITGASVGFVLFIEDVTEGKNSQATQYDLFRTRDMNPEPAKVMDSLREVGCAEQSEVIPFNEDSWVWDVDPTWSAGWE